MKLFGGIAAVKEGYVSQPKIRTFKLLDGTSLWQAGCKPLLKFDRGPLYFYTGIGGSGFDQSKAVAARKSISEAIERSAHLECRLDQQLSKRYGLDILDDSTGFAAFPEHFGNRVSQIARIEAEERWSLMQWWKGLLSAKYGERGEIKFVEFLSPFKGNQIVMWHEKESIRAYGFAADIDAATSWQRALTELSRNRYVLDSWSGAPLPAEASWIEKRLLHFAADEGIAEFEDRVERSIRQRMTIQTPKLVIDSEVKGRWSKYRKVWRVLFEGMEDLNEKTKINVFHF